MGGRLIREFNLYTSKYGIDIDISDHSAIYVTRKVAHLRSLMHEIVEVRLLKNFNEAAFLQDLCMELCYNAH